MPRPRAAAYRRLSESPLWSAQRRYYERAGIAAWQSASVPHHVTNNVALATAYARVVLGFLHDTASREPLQIVELGAGPGRFAFLFLRAFEALGGFAPGAVPVRYVMTDVAEATIAFWRRHPALAPFLRSGRLDFARFDAERDDRVRLERARQTMGARRPAARLVVIANYVFSGLRQDAFTVRDGRLYEYLAATTLTRGGSAADVALTWRRGPRVTAPYADREQDGLVNAAAAERARGPWLFPISALRTLHRLAALSRDALLVVAADRAEPIDRAGELGLGRHGAVSFPVSFATLEAWTARRGGYSLRPPRRVRHVHVAGFVLGGRGARWANIRRAHTRALSGGGPDALYAERRRRGADRGAIRASGLVSLMRRCGPDPRVIAECVRPLWPHLPDAGVRLRRAVRESVLAAWPNYYHFGERHDVPFDLGLLLYAIRAYADARVLFEASLRFYGDDAATHWNLGLCHVALGNARAARTSFARARRLAPALQPAGPATVKWTVVMRRDL